MREVTNSHDHLLNELRVTFHNKVVIVKVTRDTADMIIAEAREIVEERGEAGLRVSELAERCGVAVGLLYHYFADREAIITEVRRSQFVSRVRADIEDLKTMSVTGDNASIFSTIVDEFADPRHPERITYRLSRMEVIAHAARNPDLLDELQGIQAEMVTEIVATIRNAKKSGLVDHDVDELSLAFFLEVIPLGTALGLVYGENLPDPEKWREFVTRVLLSLLPDNR